MKIISKVLAKKSPQKQLLLGAIQNLGCLLFDNRLFTIYNINALACSRF